ncbi:uncharacterized protein LOC115620377 isoform X2 [Scaptodrosophila lebanonensis]|nr:uncharacterized protein LOC115620377 isoform X2 [Scaptodrosophila lebanonensis]
MSNARELALIEKWADIATPPQSLSPISPTSPRAVKLCCCPQRRRYNLKHPKAPNTLHARNIFVDNDFTYIDDVPRASDGGKSNTKSNSNICNNSRGRDCDSDYDDIVEIGGNSNNSNSSGHDGNETEKLMNQRNAHEQWRQDKGKGSNSNSNSNSNRSSNNSCTREQQQQQIQRLSNSIKLQQQQQQQYSNKENTLRSGKNSNSAATQDKNILHYNYCKLPEAAEPKVEPQTNNSNSNSTNNNSNSNSGGSKNSDNSNLKIDSPKSQNKMTITNTTNVAAAATATPPQQSKQIECGLTAAATQTAKPTPATRPTTPSRLKTVIKTTMVKRSPSHDSTSATSSHMLLPSSCSNDSNNTNRTTNGYNDVRGDEPRRSVKERIAAYAAGNEQQQQQQQQQQNGAGRQHDNNNGHFKKFTKIQCNKNQNNMTSDVKSAISSGSSRNGGQQQHQTLINGSSNTGISNGRATPSPPAPAAAPAAAATIATAASTNTSLSAVAIAADTTRYKSGLSDVAATVADDEAAAIATATATSSSIPLPAAASVFSTGCATMPRTRLTQRAGNLSGECNGEKYGSNAAAMTVDNKFLGSTPDANTSSAHQHQHYKLQFSDKCAAKLATLENLDLARSLDLIDDDSDDPYGIMEEYLERVKLEINEVFELRKAQRLQQMLAERLQAAKEEHQLNGNDSAMLDDSSRSTESDSELDSSATSTAAAQPLIKTKSNPVTTKLSALPPPPLSPTSAAATVEKKEQEEQTLKRRTPRNAKPDRKAPATTAAAEHSVLPDDTNMNIWANKFLRDLDSLISPDKALSPQQTATGLHCSTSACNSPTSRTAPMLLSAAASAAIQSRYGKGHASAQEQLQSALVLKPEKHATIPLQSFNLDCGPSEATATATPATKSNVAYLRTLSAPGTSSLDGSGASEGINGASSACAAGKTQRKSLTAFNGNAEPAATHKLTNFQSVLKIEEIAAAAAAKANTEAATGEATTGDELKSRRHRQLASDMEDMDMLLHATLAAASSMPKRERINHATAAATTTMTMTTTATANMSPTLTTTKLSLLSHGETITPPPANGQPQHHQQLTSAKGAAAPTGYLLHSSDVTKKGSTSTIWTSEESILRSVGAADEDNNSTSSSACEEAAGVLSSGKSGISLDSSGLDNDNNESGIGTATPPKDMSHWKSHQLHHRANGSSGGGLTNNDNESISSLEALRKIKFPKSGSVASSDDPDLLEVLSLCDEAIHGNESQDDMLLHDDQKPQPKLRRQQQQPQKGETEKATTNEYDECLDDFMTGCDWDCTDGDASSSGGGTSATSGSGTTTGELTAAAPVVLRRRYNAVLAPCVGRGKNHRSYSLDTTGQQQLHQHHHLLPRKLPHLQGRPHTKERAQLSLALRQEPFQSLLSPNLHHFGELPSPSSASLHSGHEGGIGLQEQLTTKSNSAPLLLKERERSRRCDDFAAQHLTLRYSRSQSDRYLAEIEAVEACKWLRAAGFPQYAQMYEDHQFPIDLTNVAKDHTNLENDQLQSLYRRLCVLNRCANMRLDQSHKPQTPQQKEESDDENFALSENWTFQPHIRRWSRIGEMGLELPPPGKLNVEKTESSSKESSPDRFEDDAYDISGAGITLMIPGASKGDATDTSLNESVDGAAARLRRTGSERIKDGAKALLRRVESIKSRRRKRQNRENVIISGPQVLDFMQLGQRSSMRKPDAVYSTPPSPSAVSPMHTFPKVPFFGNELKVPSHSENFLSPNRSSPKRTPTTPRSMRTSPLHFFSSPMPHLKEGKSDDSSSYYSDSQESSTGGKLSLRKPSKARRFLQRSGKVDDIGAHSDSECHQGRKLLIKDANSNTTEVKIKKLTRGGSLNLGKDPKKREGFRSSSFRSRSTTRKEPKNEEEGGSGSKRTPVVRWHSFQMEERPNMIFRKCFSQKIEPNIQEQDVGIPFAAMSAGQLQIIRKLALVTLTGYMERYCPTHRSGWNWELPKFIKKIKMPDYKDKKVFGVPLLLVLQRTGQTLPIAVRAALRWLQLNALDQVGIFRKSGGKSRIMKLREIIESTESTAECMDVFDTQQAYDVADMLKQYFRELPESLLTTKMSETFVAIFQHLPPEVRIDAVQCAVLLLPDENREILYVLLEFLTIVAANSQQNQMTSNNLGVCLAQSIFHSSISTGTASVSASPRRKGKGSGMPDMKELAEAKASHECLSFMIEHYKPIYTAAKEKLGKCNFGYMEESKPVPLEMLGEGFQFHNWRGYLYECTSATIKEGREKTRGWFTITCLTDSNVDIAYKKVGDGHPLRLWRCSTEIEGPPREVLDYIIKQRASWDVNLLQCQTVKKLDDRTEIYQYALDGQLTTDFCVLRSWQTDLPRGACVIVETSIDHAKAKPLFGAVRGVVLASRYLIEPCGSGRSRVMHLARVDIKGKTPEWYNKNYGHICSHYLSRIRLAFKHVAEGPESKV